MEGKTILVAGASGLLGSKIVTELLRQGAEVIAADIDETPLLAKLSEIDEGLTKVKFEKMDITNEAEVISFFEDCNCLDGAVNSTYPRNSNYGKHFFDVTMESFNENLSLHLGSAFLFAQQCAAYFKRKKSNFSLVNVSSVYGVVAPKFGIYENTEMTMPVEYAAIKSAILHLNKYIVAYVGDSKFRINCISPGGIFDHQPPEFLNSYCDATLGKGMLEPEDMLGTISYLLSDASKYVNAQNIIVDDGFSL
ncbi:MAG: oxidoreductase [Neptuniibacter sp.]